MLKLLLQRKKSYWQPSLSVCCTSLYNTSAYETVADWSQYTQTSMKMAQIKSMFHSDNVHTISNGIYELIAHIMVSRIWA